MAHLRTIPLALCMMFGAAGPALAEAPDMILFGGRIVTIDDTFSIHEAVAIRGPRILAVGSNTRLRALAGTETKVIDLGGRTVIPGLIDNHNHIIRATEHWADEARLDGVTSRSRALELFGEKVRALSPGAWMFTLGGWHEDQFIGDSSDFSLDELDAVAPQNPVFIQAIYDHAYVNSAWLAEMGFPVVAAGNEIATAEGLARDIVRDGEGRATGRLNGGFPMVVRAIERFPRISEPEQIAGIKAAMRHVNSLGLTTIFDAGGVGIQDASYDRFQALADRGELSTRIFYTLWGGIDINTPEAARRFAAKIKATRPFQGDVRFDRIAMGEVYYGPFHWDDMTRTVAPTAADITAAREILVAAAAGGWQVQTHAIHPANMDRLFDIMAGINKTHPLRALRWSITHADNIGAGQIERARALGMNLQLRSQRVIGGLSAVFEKFGDAVHHMPPLRLVQDSGVTYGLGTDGTKAAQINPFVTLWWATTGRMLNGTVITKEVLTREEALIAHTRSNALMIFQEANLGAIRPGFLADMVILDRDYMTVPLDDIKDIRPVATIVGGRIVFGGL